MRSRDALEQSDPAAAGLRPLRTEAWTRRVYGATETELLTRNPFAEDQVKGGLNPLRSKNSLPQTRKCEFPHLGSSCLPRAGKEP